MTKVEYCQKRIEKLGDRIATRDDLFDAYKAMLVRSAESMSILDRSGPYDHVNYCWEPKFLYYIARDVFHFFNDKEIHCVRLENGRILMDQHQAGKCPYYEYPDKGGCSDG
jgi:hypothetical protein